MLKKGKILGIFAMTAALLTGCADAMPTLTQEESDMIAEYAAGLLLKYSSNYDYRLVDEETIAAAIQAAELEQALLEASQEQENGEEESTEPENPETAASETESTEPETEEAVTITEDLDADLAQLLGIEGISMQYQSYGVYDSYPESSKGFSVDAAQGKKLLVVRFDIENTAAEEVYCNLFDYSLRIRFQINGASESALTTMLPNDIGSYMETLPAGEIREIVAVAEIDGISEEEIETLEMYITDSIGGCTLRLR